MLTSACISRSSNFPLVADSWKWGRGLSSGPIRRAQGTVSGAVGAEGMVVACDVTFLQKDP